MPYLVVRVILNQLVTMHFMMMDECRNIFYYFFLVLEAHFENTSFAVFPVIPQTKGVQSVLHLLNARKALPFFTEV